MVKFILSNFTKNNIDFFKKLKYKLDDDNVLLNYIINEKNDIKLFMCQNSFDIKFNTINNKKIIDKFNKFCESDWVLTHNIKPIINKTYKIHHISWGDNNIYVIGNNFKERFVILIYIIEYLKFKSKFNKVFDIYFVLSDLTKYLPTKKEIIDVRHVNTGYTDFSKDIIFIWRREEFEKVLFHEVIHYTQFFDHNINIHHHLNIKGPESYYEAVTDLWAIIYNSIYISFMIDKPIKYIFEIELGFVKNQALLLHNYFNDNIVQESPAYSYYIIKYLLFDYLIKYNKDPTEINDEIITSAVKQNILINNKYIKLKSLRMTLFELS